MTNPTPVAVKLFGGAVIIAGGAPAGGAAAHRHRLALLAVLATSASPVSRDKLIALLWPERDEEAGRNLLKVAVHGLRTVLGDDAILTVGDHLALGETLPCDVVEFERALTRGALDQAVRGYGGPFMDGFHLQKAPELERLVERERSRLTQSYVTALERLGNEAESKGDFTAAVRWWRILAGRDPVRADVAVRLVRALAAQGDVAGALRHADVYAQLARDTMDLAPDPAVPRLAAELRARPPGVPYIPPAPPRASESSAGGPALPGLRRRTVWRVVVGAAVVVAIGLAVLLSRSRAATDADTDPEGGALLFAGHGGARTDVPVTNKLDDIAYDLMVRYDGRLPGSEPEVIIYNGHTGTTGWGVILPAPDSLIGPGTVTVLAGGVVIRRTPLVLRKGVWQHLVIERRNWHVTVKLDDLTYDAGALIVNQIGTSQAGTERTSLGGNFASSDTANEAFHGAIARAGIKDLSSGHWIERWNFEEGQGSTTTGERGSVLTISNGAWLGSARR